VAQWFYSDEKSGSKTAFNVPAFPAVEKPANMKETVSSAEVGPVINSITASRQVSPGPKAAWIDVAKDQDISDIVNMFEDDGAFLKAQAAPRPQVFKSGDIAPSHEVPQVADGPNHDTTLAALRIVADKAFENAQLSKAGKRISSALPPGMPSPLSIVREGLSQVHPVIALTFVEPFERVVADSVHVAPEELAAKAIQAAKTIGSSIDKFLPNPGQPADTVDDRYNGLRAAAKSAAIALYNKGARRYATIMSAAVGAAEAAGGDEWYLRRIAEELGDALTEMDDIVPGGDLGHLEFTSISDSSSSESETGWCAGANYDSCDDCQSSDGDSDDYGSAATQATASAAEAGPVALPVPSPAGSKQHTVFGIALNQDAGSKWSATVYHENGEVTRTEVQANPARQIAGELASSLNMDGTGAYLVWMRPNGSTLPVSPSRRALLAHQCKDALILITNPPTSLKD